MFRKLTAIVLILSVVAANFSKLFIYAGFELNKKYIASELCENKDNFMMHCEGQCYLSKKLKQAHEKESDRQQEPQRYHFQEACITEKFIWTPQAPLNQTHVIHEVPFHLPRFSFVIFQPPQV